MARSSPWYFLLLLQGVLAADVSNPDGGGESCSITSEAPHCVDEHQDAEGAALLQLGGDRPCRNKLAKSKSPPLRAPLGSTYCSQCLSNGSIVSLSKGRVTSVKMPHGGHPVKVMRDAAPGTLKGPLGAWPGGWKTFVDTKPLADEITWFSTDFEVPEAPAAEADETTTYIFPGLTDVDNAWILQPVLQWGTSFCGPSERAQWTYQSYMVPIDPNQCSHASSFLKVQVGQKLRGEMELMPCGSWRVTSTVLDTGASTTLIISGARPQKIPDLTFELYSTVSRSQCDAYPKSPVTFSNVQLATTAGRVDSIPWVKHQDVNCFGLVQISSAGDVTLSGGACAIDSTTTCPYSSETCSGTTCCPGDGTSKSFQCPSADPDFQGCDVPMKMSDCTGLMCGARCNFFTAPYDYWNTYRCFCAGSAGSYHWGCNNGTNSRQVDLNCQTTSTTLL